jgi:hypothetical protein
MLFDLQSGRRRRFIQVVFGALAVLFAVSFVFFGIGSEVGGGFGDLIGQGTPDNPQEDEIEDAEKALETNPADAAALAELVTLHYQASNTQREVIDDTTGETRLTSEGEDSLEQGADAWNRLVKVSNGAPDTGTATIAVQLFSTLAREELVKAAEGSGEEALASADNSLANYVSAAEAQKIAAGPNGNPQQLAQVAVYYFLGADYAAAEEAAKVAIAAAPAGQRAKLQKSIDANEKQARQINDQIEAFRKQLAKITAGAPGAGGEENPLSDLGGGGLSGGSGLTTP